MSHLNQEMVKTRAQEIRENLGDYEAFLAAVGGLMEEGR